MVAPGRGERQHLRPRTSANMGTDRKRGVQKTHVEEPVGLIKHKHLRLVEGETGSDRHCAAPTTPTTAAATTVNFAAAAR